MSAKAKRRTEFLLCVFLLAALPAMAGDWPQLLIGHAALAGATNAPAGTTAKVGLLRWFFTHASVGGNLVTGLNVLHQENATRYPLQIYEYNGDNGDYSFHGAVATAGEYAGADYRAAADPTSTSNGFVYECMRDNPWWSNKLTCFSNSVVESGWRFPKVNVAMDKFCWIDPSADPAEYCAMMNGLEARFPQTLFVYMTMPLTTDTAGSDNDLRNDFNRYVRTYCRTEGKWLLDIADIEAWSEAGVEQTYVSSGVTNQRMTSAYALDPGGDFHLKATCRRRVALGWYALAQALFATDRDADGVRDGEELMAGTAPTNAEDRLAVTFDSGTDVSQQVLRWPSASNRWYSIQESTDAMLGPPWSNRVSRLPATPPDNVQTVSVSGAWSFLRLAVEQ